MNHERQMPKVKLILMSSKQQMTHEELLEEVQSIYSTDTPEFWNEITDDELWQMKNEAEREEIIGADFEEFDFGITVLRSKEQLLASIDNAKMRYQMEAQQEQPPHTQAFYRNVEHLLSKFHGKVETTIFPQKLDHWWYYAFRELNAAPDSVTVLKKKWSYVKLKDGTLEITSYKGDEEEVEIPPKIGRDAVTSIGDDAFSASWSSTKKNKENKMRIIAITIPDTVVRIGDRAFEECGALKTIG